MITEILTYHHSLDWNIEQFVDSTGLANIVQPHWSMVTSTRSGLVSTDSVGKDLFELKKKRGRPTELRNSTTDSLGSFVANKLHLNGLITNVSAECSGSIHALYTASAISLSQQQPVIVFCADNLVDDAMQMWRFSSMGALDQSSGRAFDSTSAGLRMGRGMVAMLVKHPSVKFNMSSFATISNYIFRTNPKLIANPGDAHQLARDISGIDFDTIDFWNAHATGTPVGDQFEYDLFNTLVHKDIPIVSYKSRIGHCISASGAIEMCMSFDDYRAKTLRPNVLAGDPIVKDSRIIVDPVPFPGKRILKANFGFGGKNSFCQIDIE